MSWTTLLFVQINDFYQIDYRLDPANPDSMVLPRLATLLKNIRKLPHSVTFGLPGDFLSPACLSRQFHGAQMIDLLNRLGLDFTMFGNHEFDFEEDGFRPRHLYKCLERSHFDWVCSNFEFAPDPVPVAFAKHPRCVDLVEFRSGSNVALLLGLLYADEFSPFGRTTDPVAACRKQIEESRDSYDGITPIYIAMTHQTLEQDRLLARECPELRLIMGGHDHDVAEKSREDGCLIVKAKSNARSVRLNWVVRLPVEEFRAAAAQLGGEYDPLKMFVVSQFIRSAVWTAITGELKIDRNHPRFPLLERYVQNRGLLEGPGILRHRVGDDYILVFSIPFDTEVLDFVDLFPEDRSVRKAIDKWVADYPGAKRVLMTAVTDLAIADKLVRRGSTNFGNFAADVVRACGENAGLGVVNGGSFRLGRNVQRSEPITARTLCEIFFHPNEVILYRMQGSLVRDLLLQSLAFRNASAEGHGDFLQIAGASVDATGPEPVILIGDEPLDPNRLYTISTTGYVAKIAYKAIFDAAELVRVVHPNIRDAVQQALETNTPIDEVPRWRF